MELFFGEVRVDEAAVRVLLLVSKGKRGREMLRGVCERGKYKVRRRYSLGTFLVCFEESRRVLPISHRRLPGPEGAPNAGVQEIEVKLLEFS